MAGKVRYLHYKRGRYNLHLVCFVPDRDAVDGPR